MREINGKTRTSGLIGNPVEHTLSPLIHNTLAKMYDINEDAVKQRKYRLKHKIIAMSYKFL